MARKSRWQQFADAFNSTYNTLSGAFEDIEVATASRKPRAGEGGEPLEGLALERARYNALADIRTKYGDPEGGLALRNAAEAYSASAMQNDVASSTMNERVWQTGAGTSEQMRANTGLARARADASAASAAAIRRSIPPKGSLGPKEHRKQIYDAGRAGTLPGQGDDLLGGRLAGVGLPVLSELERGTFGVLVDRDAERRIRAVEPGRIFGNPSRVVRNQGRRRCQLDEDLVRLEPVGRTGAVVDAHSDDRTEREEDDVAEKPAVGGLLDPKLGRLVPLL